ncbi:MAG: hypothetical protein C7B45_05275 [Sulfobacillus acidophilus]|uniref:Uncharacterized protein n=1 Tax=Sulfobacillus acidophilus TaxID=53633 RepID=A0A2T2WKW0_9FIRM|nr:MAG: hypothetical protein C7B45_05275 [Sulfobacillus acidophilus]
MTLNHRTTVQINAKDPAHPLLTTDALWVEADVVERLARYPQEQWDEVLRMAMSIGLQALTSLDPKHVTLFHRLHELKRLKEAQDLSTAMDDGGLGQLWESIRRLDSDRYARKYWQAELERDVAQLMAKWITSLATSTPPSPDTSRHRA